MGVALDGAAAQAVRERAKTSTLAFAVVGSASLALFIAILSVHVMHRKSIGVYRVISPVKSFREFAYAG